MLFYNQNQSEVCSEVDVCLLVAVTGLNWARLGNNEVDSGEENFVSLCPDLPWTLMHLASLRNSVLFALGSKQTGDLETGSTRKNNNTNLLTVFKLITKSSDTSLNICFRFFFHLSPVCVCYYCGVWFLRAQVSRVLHQGVAELIRQKVEKDQSGWLWTEIALY